MIQECKQNEWTGIIDKEFDEAEEKKITYMKGDPNNQLLSMRKAGGCFYECV